MRGHAVAAVQDPLTRDGYTESQWLYATLRWLLHDFDGYTRCGELV